MHKIRTKTLHQEIVAQIQEMLRKGILVKGQKIDEKRLCESMGVSRTPVREALRLLKSEGLIDLIPHKGAYVSQPCIEEINDMFEVMSVLEGTCARLAATHMKEKDFKRIESLHAEIEEHYRNWDYEAYLKRNHVFHIFVQELAGNKVINDVVNETSSPYAVQGPCRAICQQGYKRGRTGGRTGRMPDLITLNRKRRS